MKISTCFFSTIASKTRGGVVCADLESFLAAVESAHAFQEMTNLT